MKRFKYECAACGRTGQKMNKEHFWPKWLIKKTGTNQTWVRWEGEKVNPMNATLPLCMRCNSDFGEGLEVPVQRIFEDLESGRGISDFEAELMVRWLWKLEGIGWVFEFSQGRYNEKYSLRQRVLHPIDAIRGHLTLAIALCDEIDPEFSDSPMRIDSRCDHSAIFVSGVFAKLAVMVVLQLFEHLIPDRFSQYRLKPKADALSGAKLFYPQVGFKRCIEAVGVTWLVSKKLTILHDGFALGGIKSGRLSEGIKS